MLFFWVQESYQGTSELSTCEGPVTLISLSTPAFSNMLSITSISWMTSNLPEGFLTDQKETHHYSVEHIVIFSQEMKFKQLVFSNNNFTRGGTYTDGNSRSFFSRSSSSVVYLLKRTHMLELNYKAILPVLAKGSRSLLQSLCPGYKLMKVGEAEKALQGCSSVGASRA